MARPGTSCTFFPLHARKTVNPLEVSSANLFEWEKTGKENRMSKVQLGESPSVLEYPLINTFWPRYVHWAGWFGSQCRQR